MSDIESRLKNIKDKLSIGDKYARVKQLLAESSAPNFWSNPQVASEKMRELSRLQAEIAAVEEIELYLEEDQEEKAEDLLEKLEFSTFLSGPHNLADAIFSIHSGQGGVEAMDWAEMLLRMYQRYFDKQGWKVVELNRSLGEEAGIKSVSLQVEGRYAFGYLKGEAGVHRLVRLSPFNANNLRQTSFAMVEVVPVIEDTAQVELNEEDIEFEATHASGHGGQNVNKVATAVRLRHRPSGIVVSCQAERSQARNREIALRMLQSKLYVLEEQKKRQEADKLKGEYKTPGWGNQIRSYVLHPYKMVKDLRTGVESSDPEGVLDGNLDPFIEAEVRKLNNFLS